MATVSSQGEVHEPAVAEPAPALGPPPVSTGALPSSAAPAESPPVAPPTAPARTMLTIDDPCPTERRAVLRALRRWCRDPTTAAERPYYDLDGRQTKLEACRVLRTGISRCAVTSWGGDGWFVDFPYSSAWHLDAHRRRRGWQVDRVDFEEDCTGP